jgi:recombination protein RecR
MQRSGMVKKSAFDDEHHPFGAPVARLVSALASLPGIGRKSAERIANHLVMCPRDEALALSEAIQEVKDSIRHCRVCNNLTEQEVCSICSDPRRDRRMVCVVEQPKDVIALESTGAFQGTYHVLGGRIAPLEGVGPEELSIASLMRRIRQDGVTEVVMATNPNMDGDGTALFISNLLEESPVRITRLARGIASGSVLEFANKQMLFDALQGRHTF